MERWHIAMLEPRASGITHYNDDDNWESKVARLLRIRGYRPYYPCFPKLRPWGGHGAMRMVREPMFRGYMFVNESHQGWDGLRTTPGVRTHQSLLISPVTGRLAILPEGEIERIEEAVKRITNEILNPPPKVLPFGVGDRVRITDGAFQDRYGTIETLDEIERIELLIDIFGRSTRAYVSHEHLAAL